MPEAPFQTLAAPPSPSPVKHLVSVRSARPLRSSATQARRTRERSTPTRACSTHAQRSRTLVHRPAWRGLVFSPSTARMASSLTSRPMSTIQAQLRTPRHSDEHHRWDLQPHAGWAVVRTAPVVPTKHHRQLARQHHHLDRRSRRKERHDRSLRLDHQRWCARCCDAGVR